MAVTTFAAIDISSYEITMKIFEFSKKGGFRTVDHGRVRCERLPRLYHKCFP